MKRFATKDHLIFLIPIGLILISLILYPWLPEEIPMQFEADGSSSWTLPKMYAIWTMPLLEIVLLFMSRAQGKKTQAIMIVVLLTIIQIAVLCITLI